ncbi:MAG: ATP-binding protein [Actinomycetota bacterium]
MRQRAWIPYLVGGACLAAMYLFGPAAFNIGPIFNLFGASSVVAILVGIKLHKPEYRLPWYLFALGQAFFVTGDVISYNYERFFGTQLPYPAISDLFYLSVYPCLIAGLLLLIRRRTPGGDRASLIDSFIIVVGASVLSWVYLMAPYAQDPTLTIFQKLISMAYPLMDLLLLAVLVRLAVGVGRRGPSFYLLTGSVVSLLAVDSIYAWILLNVSGGYATGGKLDIGWIAFYLLWGAAALHPSMRSLEEEPPEQEEEPAQSRRRLIILAGASFLAPLVQLFQVFRGDPVKPAGLIAAYSMVLFSLVLIRLRGLMVDVSEHRRTERQLRETEARYRSLVEGMPAAVYIAEFGAEGGWLYVSPRIEQITGYTSEEWMVSGELWNDRIVADDRDAALEAEQRLLRGEGRLQCEYRLIGKDGRILWIREEADALPDEKGRPVALQGVMYDITEQKRIEERLREALSTEKEATQRLTALREMEKSFMQAVSHDIRTPLTTILGSATMLERDDLKLSEEDAKELTRGMAWNARRLHRLVTNLLDLDRLSASDVAENRELTDIGKLTETVLRECIDEDHPIRRDIEESVLAEVDSPQVERIVENLVTNAIRYTPPGTPIWVSIRSENDGALLIVEDAGPGVPEELRATIFEPFRQGNESVKHNPGVGIGLSLVSRFAEIHGGRAWVDERDGGGASFKVFLPRNGSSSDGGTSKRAVSFATTGE